MQNETVGIGKILIMEDDRMVREAVCILLRAHGYSAFGANEGNETIDLFRNALLEGTPFNAAILDLIVDQGMGGKEAAIELRKSSPALPIIAASGYSTDPIMASPRDFGFTDSIGKPFRAAQLIAKLEYHLQTVEIAR